MDKPKVPSHIEQALKKRMADRLRANLTELRMEGFRLGLIPERRHHVRPSAVN